MTDNNNRPQALRPASEADTWVDEVIQATENYLQIVRTNGSSGETHHGPGYLVGIEHVLRKLKEARQQPAASARATGGDVTALKQAIALMKDTVKGRTVYAHLSDELCREVLAALASGDANGEGLDSVARTIAGKLMRAGLLNEPHAPEPPDDLMEQIMAIVLTALAAPRTLVGTPPREAGGDTDPRVYELETENAKLKDDYNAEVDEFNAGFDAGNANLNIDEAEQNYNLLHDVSADVFRAGYAWGAFDRLRACEAELNKHMGFLLAHGMVQGVPRPVAAASTGEGAE